MTTDEAKEAEKTRAARAFAGEMAVRAFDALALVDIAGLGSDERARLERAIAHVAAFERRINRRGD